MPSEFFPGPTLKEDGHSHPATQVVENTLFPFWVFSSNNISNDYAPERKEGKGFTLDTSPDKWWEQAGAWTFPTKHLPLVFLPPGCQAATAPSWSGSLLSMLWTPLPPDVCGLNPLGSGCWTALTISLCHHHLVTMKSCALPPSKTLCGR